MLFPCSGSVVISAHACYVIFLSCCPILCACVWWVFLVFFLLLLPSHMLCPKQKYGACILWSSAASFLPSFTFSFDGIRLSSLSVLVLTWCFSLSLWRLVRWGVNSSVLSKTAADVLVEDANAMHLQQ